MPDSVPVLTAPAEWTTDRVPGVEDVARGLLGPTGSRLVVDLAATNFLASSGLTSLIHLGKRLHEAGGGLALARPTTTVLKLLRAVGLTRVLRVFDSIEAARADVRAARSTTGGA